jgi:two-component system, sensor histidine kinase and response regulator
MLIARDQSVEGRLVITAEPVAAMGRVLFVDDDPFYRDIAQETLASAGYVVSMAESGAAAIDSLDRAQFDLVVLDLGMPGVTGFDVISAVRAGRRNQNVPILVITGHDDADSVARAFDGGATSFLAKPLNWMLFVHHVQFVLKAARAEADLRHANRTTEFMSDLKSRLVGTLVTEFQSPLRNAAGFSKLLSEEADGPIQSDLYRAWIGELHRAVERMSATHLKMLNFGRSLSEGITLKEEIIAIGPLIETIVQGCSEAALRRHLRLMTAIDVVPELEITGDRVLLAQAIRNVIDNAIRLSRRATDVTVRVGTDSAGQLFIEVSDTTPPLSASEIEDILGLKPYASTRPESVEASTGMKLSRVLIDAHQGKVHMKSLGEGMLTELRLPRHRVLGAQAATDQVNRLREVAAALQSNFTDQPRRADYAPRKLRAVG